jgi:hypothetical protein
MQFKFTLRSFLIDIIAGQNTFFGLNGELHRQSREESWYNNRQELIFPLSPATIDILCKMYMYETRLYKVPES